MEQPTRKLYRSTTNRWIAGVCGGLAEYFSIDPIIVRIVFLVLTPSGGLGIWLYIILWIFVPTEQQAQGPPERQATVAGPEMKNQAQQLADHLHRRGEARTFIGALLIIIGGLALANTLLPWRIFQWSYLWPLIIVALGLAIIFRRK